MASERNDHSSSSDHDDDDDYRPRRSSSSSSSSSSSDEDFRRAFGDGTRICLELRESINQIKSNDPALEDFWLQREDAKHFSERAWELLGGYIANNDHLKDVELEEVGLAEFHDLPLLNLAEEKKKALFFKHLTGSTSLKILTLTGNSFGLDGIQSMVPFLTNSSLTKLSIDKNDNFNTEFFGILIDALRDGSIEYLNAQGCIVEDTSALEGCSLPHLKTLLLDGNTLQIIPSLVKYTNLEELWLSENSIGKEGCKSIANLLRNPSSKLRHLDLGSNHIGDDEAGILADSLKHNTTLTVLVLRKNEIKEHGIRSIATILQNQSSNLGRLHLDYTGIGDREAEILANSLKHNTTLRELYLEGNKFKEDGHRAFLKLLIDVSSVGSTYNSNHTLTELQLPGDDLMYDLAEVVGPEAAELAEYIHWAIRINAGREDEEDEANSEDEEDDYSDEGNPEGAGRKKVIASQLDSEERMVLCRLQRIDYCYNSLFVDINPLLLPDILSTVGERHGQNELYRMLIASVADLASIIDKKAALRDRIAACVAQVADLNAEHMRKVAALDAKILEMKRELESIDSVGGAHRSMANPNSSPANKLCGKKRARSASF